MFPSKGTTVWVNVRDKPYLGKVIQTSPELDMVCVRISDYLDHVSRDHVQDNTTFSHSCPESNTSILSGRQSSVVITCGLNDVSPLDSPISHDFTRMYIDNNSNNGGQDYPLENNLEAVDINFNEDNEKIEPFESNITLPRDIQNGEDDEDEDFSNSFEIDNILRDTHPGKRKLLTEDKMWKCRYCHLYFGDENDIRHHILSEHRLDSCIESDSWIVIGGVSGFDYERVKFEDDQNIKSLNSIHLSNGSNRKRQFNEYRSPSEENCHRINGLMDSTVCDRLDASSRSDVDNSFNEMISRNSSLTRDIGKMSMSSIFQNSNDFSGLNYECIELKLHNDMIHHFILNNNFQSSIPFSLTNSLPTSGCTDRFRSNSLTVNNSADHSINSDRFVDHQPMFSSPKRTRLENSIKKCRKMYGIDQRQLWCNQCKWKKACSRFSNEINTSI